MALRNPDYLKLLTFSSQSNVKQTILAYCKERQINNLRRNYTGIAPGNKNKIFSCDLHISNLQSFDTLSENSAIAVICFYIAEVCKAASSLRSPYPPANLYVYHNDDLVRVLAPFLDKRVEDICRENPSLGCLYSYRQIDEKYKDHSTLDKKLLFQLNNSLRQEVDLQKLKPASLNTFKVQFSPKVATTLITSIDLINTTKRFVEKYFEVRDNLQLQAVLRSFKTFEIRMKQLVVKESLDLFNTSLIVQGAVYCVFLNYKYQDPDLYLFNECVDRFNTLYAPILSKLFKKDFIVRISNVRDIAEFDNTNFMLSADLLSQVIKELNLDPTSFVSDSRFLSPDIDALIRHAMYEFFLTRFDLRDPFENLCVGIITFIYLTTSPGIFTHNEPIDFKFTNNGKTFHIKFQSFQLLNTLSNRLTDLKNLKRGKNYIRLFCSARADLAMKLIQIFRIEPPLFREYPNILPYMRFDFWKGITVKNLNEEEMISLSLLQEITDYHSSGSIKAKDLIYKKLGI
nr:p60 protein [Areca palm velarivirus 1]UOV22967.1 p60 protein [Areca palm velarivirus 1]